MLLRMNSPLGRMLSRVGLELEELLLRRRLRTSSGSMGERPVARAKRLRISVRLTTPDSRPLMPDPGNWEDGTLTVGVTGVYGGPGVTSAPLPACLAGVAR
jgi:hypothetical protein